MNNPNKLIIETQFGNWISHFNMRIFTRKKNVHLTRRSKTKIIIKKNRQFFNKIWHVNYHLENFSKNYKKQKMSFSQIELKNSNLFSKMKGNSVRTINLQIALAKNLDVTNR